MKSIRIGIFSFLLLLTLFSCPSVVTIEGHVHAVNVDLPKSHDIYLVLYDPASSSTYQITTKLKADGRFKFRSRYHDMLLVDIRITSNYYSLNPILLNSKPIRLAPGDYVYLEDLYLSSKFTLSLADVSEQFSSPDKISFSWDAIEITDYYVVYIFKGDGDEKKTITVFITKEPFFSYSTSAELIPYDIKMTPTEVALHAPFFRIREPMENGQYSIYVAAIKETTRSTETTAAGSKEYTISVKGP